jgi:hypothetical protein
MADYDELTFLVRLGDVDAAAVLTFAVKENSASSTSSPTPTAVTLASATASGAVTPVLRRVDRRGRLDHGRRGGAAGRRGQRLPDDRGRRHQGRHRPQRRQGDGPDAVHRQRRQQQDPEGVPAVGRHHQRRRGRRGVQQRQRQGRDPRLPAPRQATHSTAGAAALYAAAGTAVNDKIALANDRIKIVIASGGNTKTGVFHFVIE